MQPCVHFNNVDADHSGDFSDDPFAEADVNGDAVCVTQGPDKILQTPAQGNDQRRSGLHSSIYGDQHMIHAGPGLVCETAATGDDVQEAPVGTKMGQQLRGFDDWGHLHFGGNSTVAHPQASELTSAQAEQIVHWWDTTLVPDQTVTFGPPRPARLSAPPASPRTPATSTSPATPARSVSRTTRRRRAS